MYVSMPSVIDPPNISGMFAELLTREASEPKLSHKIGYWADVAIDTCIKFAERSCVSEPHFNWSSSESVVIAPSDYQFTILDHRNYDLVLIEDDELLFRSYCDVAIAELEQYRELEDGWDGEDMPAPLPESIDDAFTFLRLLNSFLDECAEAIPMLDHEGISSLAFESATDYFSIAFYGNDKVVTYRWSSILEQNTVAKGSLKDPEFLIALVQGVKNI
ncbi:hypothetical protein [Pseudomonas sp. OB66]|uniref:hypothetical protein n=1 Tax=Pseudomonas sp. OB66 TaxID=3137730 RepID=UPI00311F0440